MSFVPIALKAFYKAKRHFKIVRRQEIDIFFFFLKQAQKPKLLPPRLIFFFS